MVSTSGSLAASPLPRVMLLMAAEVRWRCGQADPPRLRQHRVRTRRTRCPAPPPPGSPRSSRRRAASRRAPAPPGQPIAEERSRPQTSVATRSPASRCGCKGACDWVARRSPVVSWADTGLQQRAAIHADAAGNVESSWQLSEPPAVDTGRSRNGTPGVEHLFTRQKMRRKNWPTGCSTSSSTTAPCGRTDLGEVAQLEATAVPAPVPREPLQMTHTLAARRRSRTEHLHLIRGVLPWQCGTERRRTECLRPGVRRWSARPRDGWRIDSSAAGAAIVPGQVDARRKATSLHRRLDEIRRHSIEHQLGPSEHLELAV